MSFHLVSRLPKQIELVPAVSGLITTFDKKEFSQQEKIWTFSSTLSEVEVERYLNADFKSDKFSWSAEICISGNTFFNSQANKQLNY